LDDPGIETIAPLSAARVAQIWFRGWSQRLRADVTRGLRRDVGLEHQPDADQREARRVDARGGEPRRALAELAARRSRSSSFRW